MKYKNEQYLFCSKANDTVTFTIEHELRQFVGGNTGYAVHSVSCSFHRNNGCNECGVSGECKGLIAQAKKAAKEELLSE